MSIVFMRMVLGVCAESSRGATLLADVMRREANRADNDKVACVEQRRKSNLSGSSGVDVEEGEDEEEGEIISSPCSPSPKSFPSPSELFKQQVGIPTSACQAKCPQVDAGGVSVPSP
jgi:hypothetical protein